MIVLDTHAWIWWATQSSDLPRRVKQRIERASEEEVLCVSSISAWEVALLVKRGRLELTMAVDDWVAAAEALTPVRFVAVDNRIALRSVLLPEPLHNDPADRIIIATAMQLGAVVVTKDDKLRSYPHVETLW